MRNSTTIAAGERQETKDTARGENETFFLYLIFF